MVDVRRALGRWDLTAIGINQVHWANYWKTVYNRHRRWSGDGTWRAVLDRLRVDCDDAVDGEWVLGVDGTVIRAHHHAAGARREPPKDIPAHVLAPTVLEDSLRPGRSTGGWVE